MKDFFKKLFSGKEPETTVIGIASVPQLIHEREALVRTTLAARTAEPMRSIRNSSARLKHIVNTIEGAEQDPEIHPKLKSIAKNTLPQFVRSMTAALGKNLPEDPEEFYGAAVEMVKSSLNSLRGPGRYLQIAFPEEIKSARKTIDAMGHEINLITQGLSEYRSQTAVLNDARTRYLEIMQKKDDLVKAAGKEERIAARIREIHDRISQIDLDHAALMADPQMAEVTRGREELRVLESQRDETARAYASLSMTASHVLRKAEKIAIRQKHPDEITTIQHAMFLLSDHEIPDVEDLSASLAAACPIASRMIETGDIPLRNKEERAVFSDTVAFCTGICEICSKLGRDEAACGIAREALDTKPVVLRIASLEREQGQLRSMLEKELQGQKDLLEWQHREEEKIPELTEDLRKRIGGILGKNVQFQDGGLRHA